MPITAHQQLYQHAKQLNLVIADMPKITHQPDVFAVRTWIESINHSIDTHIVTLGERATEQIHQLIKLRTLAIDAILISLYHAYQLPADFALFAVGGYGRCELLPFSDVDILLIAQSPQSATEQIEQFVACLWDIGITPAFSVRSLDETKRAVSEQTIATALLEARLLTGNDALADFPYHAVKTAWQAKDFYDEKIAESKKRYLSQNATEHNLEPNLKNAPGALRDIHVIGWLGRFYFGAQSLQALVDEFISEDEKQQLQVAQAFLWCLRHHLHAVANRAEDRLLFEHQKTVAQRFGYHPANSEQTNTQALEAMMRQYYRHAMKVTALSDMLCAYFQDSYLTPNLPRQTLDDDFYLLRKLITKDSADWQIGIHHKNAFEKNPQLLLKIFLVMGKHNIKKITAQTLRAMFAASKLIDESFRQNPHCRQLFLANLQENNYLFHRLRLMNRYGVLGNYLPAFEKITGLMQYDLFHRYTVDAHTLLLVRILHRFADSAKNNVYDLASEVYNKIARKDILVIAAIFHDIAKGRGGDHSQLGAVEAYTFCQNHGLSEADSRFIEWLVLEHLTMSLTAQKQDISDPEVIGKFAQFTRNITRLNYLYVLTVADMNATNSQLWNTWRASLLKQLYINTHRALSLGMISADKTTIIQNRQDKARNLLAHLNSKEIDGLWQNFGEDYFLKQKHRDIAWQTTQILEHQQALQAGLPIIALRAHTDLSLGGIQLLICTPNQNNLFAATVCALDQLGLSVLDANILTAVIDGQSVALDMYVLIDRLADDKNKLDILSNAERQQHIINKLSKALISGECDTKPRTLSFDGKLKHFDVPTQVHFYAAKTLAHQGCHQMQLTTKDRPAILAKVGQVFSRHNIEVHGARITTLGERAEDVFYLSDKNGKPLSDSQLATLKTAIIDAL